MTELLPAPTSADTSATLREVAERVRWIATAIVDAANHGRPNASGVKVGGHQASSASMVDIMTALWFSELERHDRVSVKPHASPVLHAVNYLLGDLDASYLGRLREKGGLQSYPSRLKDPDTVDFSTGSVGIGATAAIWAALAHRYLDSRVADVAPAGRFISLVGDAELDEGAVWEAVADPAVAGLGEVLWGGRRQPPVARPRRPGRAGPPPRGHVRGGGLAGAHARVGVARSRPSSSVPEVATCADGSSRCPTRSTSGCCVPTRPSSRAASSATTPARS
ncbi:MAG: hypothetical protein PGN15_09920 [Aeromicrobium erythreum]